MNKLAIALTNGIVEVGVLIVPSRELYRHLTDRIGNIGELSCYPAMWESIRAVVPRGLLAVTVVEHDALSRDPSLPHLRVGNDGRAGQGRARTQQTGRPQPEEDSRNGSADPSDS